MKRIFPFLICLCFLTFACGEDPNDVTPLDAEVVFEVNLSGDYSSSFVQDSVSAFLHSSQIIVKGFDASDNTVTVLIDPSFFAAGAQVVGTHEIGRDSKPARIVVGLADGSTFFISESGSLVVTDYSNNIIKGTFSFEGTKNGDSSSTIAGTNGKFTAVVGEI
tara:strand:+ start:4040 stop:4528 length:489 start_codon:yes stop_codon:yes gene_type:complete